MKIPILIIFSGLPGSGKTTLASLLAKELNATYLRIDTVEQALREVCQIKEVEGMGYRLSYRIAAENLKLGNLVIADSVNPWKLTRDEWNNVAENVGASYINIEIICSDKDIHRERLEARDSSVTWQQVQERDYHPWDSERICLDTAHQSIEESFAELIKRLPDIPS